jgi:predicted DNA-binding transcriptional regulator YafY
LKASRRLHSCRFRLGSHDKLHLLAYYGNWYVLAHNAEKGQIETFALSWFRGIEAAGSTFTRPADFDAQRYARQAFGITSGEKPIKVRLLFEPKLAVYVTEREWHPSQKLKPGPMAGSRCGWRQPGGRNSSAGCCPGYPDVKVLAPKSLCLTTVSRQEEVYIEHSV